MKLYSLVLIRETRDAARPPMYKMVIELEEQEGLALLLLQWQWRSPIKMTRCQILTGMALARASDERDDVAPLPSLVERRAACASDESHLPSAPEPSVSMSVASRESVVLVQRSQTSKSTPRSAFCGNSLPSPALSSTNPLRHPLHHPLSQSWRVICTPSSRVSTTACGGPSKIRRDNTDLEGLSCHKREAFSMQA